MKHLALSEFSPKDFDLFKSWIDTNELLITIAGKNLIFPLTNEQLEIYLNDPKSDSFNVIDINENKIIGHAEIIHTELNKCKLDKIIIGDKTQRGKGIGAELINLLLEYSFNLLGMEEVMLYVYDWNIAGIKCYEKAGFKIQENSSLHTKFDNKIWTALQMTISKEQWKIKANTL